MATATMGKSSVDRLARSKRPTVERAEIHIPPAPTFPMEAVTGDPARRAQAVASFNNALQKWRNDAWSIEAPFVPDAELQVDVATLEDTTAKMSAKLDRAAIDIRLTSESITTIETHITNIDNSITTINNQITVIEGNTATGTGIVQANGTGNPETAILGTPGYFPYWSATAPYLTATSPIFTDGTFTGVGTITPDVALHVAYADVSSISVTDILKLEHKALVGSLGVGAGTGILFSAASASVANREMGRIQTRWTVATDATRASAMDFQTATAGGTLSTKVTILESGFVGFGTTTPIANLHLESSSALATRWTRTPEVVALATVISSLDTYNGTFNIAQIQVQAEGVTGSGQIVFRIDTTGQAIRDRVMFKGNGYCGFGTTTASPITPEAILDARSITPDEPMFKIYRPDNTKGFRIVNYNGTDATFRLQTTTDNVAWNELLSFHVNNGFLGIGEKSPLNRIHALVSDAVTTTATVIMRFNHLSSAAAAANFGTSIYFTGKSSTTDKQDMGLWKVIWTTATDATRTSAMEWQTVNSAAALTTRMALSGAGGLSIGDGTNSIAVGVINAVTGFRVNNTNATAGWLLTSDGVNFVPAAPPAPVTPSALTRVDDTNVTLTLGGSPTVALLAATSITVGWTGQLSLARGGTNASSFTANAVIFCNAAGTALTDDGAAFTYAASGDNQLLIAKALGNVQSDNVGYYALNSTAAAAGAANQQWSPSFLWEGQGWGGSSQAVKYRAYVVPVDAATNPTAYWILERNINAIGYIELLRADSTGFLRLTKDALGATSTTGQIGFQLFNNTAAAAGAQQHSPVIVFRGFGWKTNAVAASQQVQFRMHVVPVQGAANPTAMLRIDSEINAAGSFSNPITISSLGSMSVGASYEPPFGVINAQVGFKIATGATSGTFLRGDGTNFVQSTLTIANSYTSGNVLFVSGTAVSEDDDLQWSTANNWLTVNKSINGAATALRVGNLDTTAAGTQTARMEFVVGRTGGGLSAFTAAYIAAVKEQEWTSTASTNDSKLDFYTAEDAVLNAVLSLRSTGSVICGRDGTGTTRTSDFLYIPSSAGNPTGVAEEYGSRCALVYDTTNNRIFVRNPTDDTWRSVAVA